MAINLPTELRQIIKLPYTAQLPSWVKLRDATVKKVFLLETDSQKSGRGACSNCGDVMWIYAFLALGGPYDQVSSGIPIKWIDGAWWIGFTEAYPCPDCSGESMDHVLEHEPAMEGGQGDWTI